MNHSISINPPQKKSFQQKLKQLENKQKIEEFNKNLEKGDLCLSEIIPNGFILSGDTRAGKTSLGHILSGSSLRGIKHNGQSMVVPTTSKNTKAKIGNSMNSETQVPNTFQVKLKGIDEQLNIIDTPGYGDTKGILTIFSNSYYHYRVYSKVANMKFILCFDMIQLLLTCTDFLKTIFNWSRSFKDYIKNRRQIWKSVAFMITKVQDKPSVKEDLIVKLRTISRDMNTLYEKDFQQSIKQLIEFVIQEDRIFYIKKIKDGQTLVSGDLLERIDKKVTHWWKRNIDPVRNQVDMKPITFPLAQQILKSSAEYPACRRQFYELILYYKMRIKQFVSLANQNQSDAQNSSLSFVIQKLVNDAMSHPDSHQFIKVMENYINLYYSQYDKSYKDERQKMEKKLFSIEIDPSATQKSRGQFRGKDKNYLVKKFKCLEEIEILKVEVSSIVLNESEQAIIQQIEFCAQNLYEIIKEFNRVAFKRNLASEVIYKYGYIIHRIIEQAKIFTILMANSHVIENQKPVQCTNVVAKDLQKSDKEKLINLTNGQQINLLRQLWDFMGVSFKYNKKEVTYSDLHLAFINKFNFDTPEYESLLVNEDLVNFFAYIDITEEIDMDKPIQVILKYSDKVLEEAEKLSTIIFDKEKGKLIRRLTSIRINSESSYELKKRPEQKNYLMFIIRKATKNLGKLLELLGNFQLSRQVYSTIRFVDSVCKLYHSEINMLKKASIKNESTRKKQLDLRIQFIQYLKNHFREHEAIEVLQQSFELAENAMELKKVTDYLTNIKLNMKDSTVCDYQQKLFSQEYFDIFGEKLEEKLEKFSHTPV